MNVIKWDLHSAGFYVLVGIFGCFVFNNVMVVGVCFFILYFFVLNCALKLLFLIGFERNGVDFAGNGIECVRNEIE